MDNVLGTFFDNAVKLLQGTATKSAFVLVLCFLFLGCASGKVSWGKFFIVVLAAGGLFSASYIGQQIWS